MSRKKQSKSAPAPHYDIDQVRAYARHRWPEILQALCGISPDLLTGEHCPCPRCGGTDRFRFSDMDGNGSAICNQCLKDAGDGFAVVQHYTGKKFAEVLAMVAEYLGIAPSERPAGKSSGKQYNRNTPADPAESLEFLPWAEGFTGNDMAARIWCTWKRPVTLAAIKAVGGLIAKHQGIEVIAIPVWGESLDAAPPVGYVLYNLTGGTLPRKAKNKETGRWEVVEELKVKLAAGSKPGIICDLARLRSARVVAKVEGPSDCLGLLSLDDLPDDVCPLATANGAGEKPAAWMLDLLAGPEDNRRDAAWVIHDADLPGQSGATGYTDEKTGSFRPGWCNYLAPLLPTRNVALPFEVVETHGQDLRDFLTLGSTEELPVVAAYTDLLALVENAEVIPAGDSAALALTTLADLSSPDTDTVLEEDDDPHYLARVNLARYASLSNGGCIRYWREQFYTWKPCRACYRVIHRDEFSAKVTSSIKAEFNRQWLTAYSLWKAADPDSRSDEPPKARKVTSHLVKNVVAACASLTLIPSSVELSTWIEDDPATAKPIRERRPYIAMLNGVINIDDLLDVDSESDPVLPHSPHWFSTVRLPYEFKADAECPRWLSFLDKSLQGDINRISILQEWAGYCLTPDTSYQKFLAMEGEGGNGKSVFMAGLQAMLGAENCSHIGLERFAGDSFDAGETFGKLVNICADVGEIDKLAEGNLKSFTSGDVMSFKRKFLGNLTAKPTARLILSFNNRPRFSDRSQGVWRRMLLIPWLVQIKPTERVLGMDSAEWWQQTGELPGIFNWALKGLYRLRMQKQFSHSDLVSEAIQDYQDEANPVRTYLKENFEYGRGFVRCKDAYKFYMDWAVDSGHRPMNDRTFGKEFHRMFPNAERKYGGSRGNRFWYYHEIKFSQDEINGKTTPQENFLEGGFDD